MAVEKNNKTHSVAFFFNVFNLPCSYSAKKKKVHIYALGR